MNKKFKKIIAVACCLTVSAGVTVPLAVTAGCSSYNDSYNVVYNLNYEGADSRTITVPCGARAVNWEVDRTGYNLEGWFTDEACTKKANMRKAVTQNVTYYAKWEKKDGVLVTFDENYQGAHYPAVIENQKGKIVDEIYAPQVSRLGHVFTGWYKDKACTQKWDFNTDTVSGDTTLYAGYKRDGSMKLDEEGNPVYENVTVNLWLGAGWNSEYNNTTLWNLAKRFNAEYRGKINVNVTYNLYDQDYFSLRFQKTPNKNETDQNYYSIAEIYDLAGLTYSDSDWYEGAIKDSYVDGRLTSVPVAAGVPYLVYNKTLMKKYNGDEALPSTYAEFASLMQAVCDGETPNNPDFRGMTANTSNTFIEATSYAAFAQNGADYFEFKNGEVVNDWNNLDNVQTALTNVYEMFGKTGKFQGYLYGDDAWENGVRGDVKSGKAMFGIVSWPTVAADKLPADLASGEVGILPLSGLFADGEYKDRITVHSLGLGFYRAQNLSNTELAAAGLFADYVSRNSHMFAQNGWYPVRKSAVESDEFRNSENDIVKIVKQTGNPENFYTLDGSKQTLNVVNNYAFQRNILRAVNSEEKLTEEDLAQMAAYLKKSIIDAR